jgi:hypothetical protein
MYTAPKNDKTIMEAVKASNSGHHTRAAALFQEAGNQYRNPEDKRELWQAAERARRIANSD